MTCHKGAPSKLQAMSMRVSTPHKAGKVAKCQRSDGEAIAIGQQKTYGGKGEVHDISRNKELIERRGVQ